MFVMITVSRFTSDSKVLLCDLEADTRIIISTFHVTDLDCSLLTDMFSLMTTVRLEPIMLIKLRIIPFSNSPFLPSLFPQKVLLLP